MNTDIAQFFIALKRTRGCMMMLEGSVAEDLYRMQAKNLPHPTLMRALFHNSG